ncbi:MAG: glutamate synthase subunit beta, partial [Dysosmobacter sp.]
MGKPTGFLEYTRRDVPAIPPEERVQNWDEFHLPLPEPIRAQQGARCMNCGVPFCQSGMIWEGKTFGCPLHNLIPEWNDMIMSGNLGHALSRLLKVNNFPEFTGRVCPAPCEDACVCGIYGSPITIRDNELCI